MSFRVCINCYGIRVYPYMGFMVGQRYQCQDCQEQMVIPLEFDTQEDYEAFAKQMGVAVNDQEEKMKVLSQVSKYPQHSHY